MAVQSLISIFLQSLCWTRDGKHLIDGIRATSIILHTSTAHDRHHLSIMAFLLAEPGPMTVKPLPINSRAIALDQIAHGHQVLAQRALKQKESKRVKSWLRKTSEFWASTFSLLSKCPAPPLPACWHAHCYRRQVTLATGGRQSQRPTNRVRKPAHSRKCQCTGIEDSSSLLFPFLPLA